MNVWDKIFSKTGKKGEPWPVSEAQCGAARAVFGGSLPPETEAQCAAYEAQFKAMVQKQADDIIAELQAAVESLTEQLVTIDERIAAVESARMEEKMFTSRLGSMAFADDPAGSLATIGHKEKTPPPPADWIDRAQHLAGDDAREKRKGVASQPLNQRLSPGHYRRRQPGE